MAQHTARLDEGKKEESDVTLGRGGWETFFLMFCRHTASAPIKSGTHTGGVQQ